MSTANPLDHIAIQNVISRYCEALDTKMLSLLTKVFSSDVVADYPFKSNMKGVDTIITTIQQRLGPIRTHHSLTTQTIIFAEALKSANAVTYFTGVHFGQGPHDGKVLTAYGRYVDELVCLPAEKPADLEGVPGASGIWRISKRTVIFTSRVGDEKIMIEY